MSCNMFKGIRQVRRTWEEYGRRMPQHLEVVQVRLRKLNEIGANNLQPPPLGKCAFSKKKRTGKARKTQKKTSTALNHRRVNGRRQQRAPAKRSGKAEAAACKLKQGQAKSKAGSEQWTSSSLEGSN